MCLMHKEDTYGKLVLKQKFKQTDKQEKNFALMLAKLLPFDIAEIETCLSELIEEKVLIIHDDILICKRMVKDAETSTAKANAGKLGGTKTQQKIKKSAKAESEAFTENEIKNEIYNLNGYACYNAEEYILGNQIIFERICMAVSKKQDEVKTELHKYHLWMAKNEKYPLGKKAAEAGIESWILNAQNFKKTYNGTDKSGIDKNRFNAGALELLERGKKIYSAATGKQSD